MIYLSPKQYSNYERVVKSWTPSKPLTDSELAGYEKWRAARLDWDHDTCCRTFYKVRWVKHRYRYRDRP